MGRLERPTIVTRHVLQQGNQSRWAVRLFEMNHTWFTVAVSICVASSARKKMVEALNPMVPTAVPDNHQLCGFYFLVDIIQHNWILDAFFKIPSNHDPMMWSLLKIWNFTVIPRNQCGKKPRQWTSMNFEYLFNAAGLPRSWHAA